MVLYIYVKNCREAKAAQLESNEIRRWKVRRIMGSTIIPKIWLALKSRIGVGAVLFVLGLLGAMLYIRTNQSFELISAIICIPFGAWVCISGIREKRRND